MKWRKTTDMAMDRLRRRPPMEGFSPGGLGRGGEFQDDDSVEGHIVNDEIKDQDQDTEGHIAKRMKATPDDDDTEGHGTRPALKATPDDDDTEGHSFSNLLRQGTGDEDEGRADKLK